MKKTRIFAFLAMAATLLASSCSDSSTSPSPPSSFSANISGTWSGTTTIFGSTAVVTMSITQPTSDPAAAVTMPLTGTLSISGGAAWNVTGGKEGNAWSVSGSAGDTIVTIHQTLTSATTGVGDLTLQVGPPSNKGTVPLNLVKS